MKYEVEVICLDLDGVLAQYNGWKGMENIGEPLPGAIAFCEQMIEEGYKLIVHSCRHRHIVEPWLIRHGFPRQMEVESNMNDMAHKPIASIYVDDRGIKFKGNFKVLLEEIKLFKVWWAK